MTIWDITTTNYWQDSTAPGAIVLNAAPGVYTAPSDEQIEDIEEEEKENESSSETTEQTGGNSSEGEPEEPWANDKTQWYFKLASTRIQGEGI